MRGFLLSLGLLVALLVPKTGSAQVYAFRSPPPEITAAAAEWQVNSELLPFAGLVYSPTREFRLFDGGVMAQIGIYKGVPVYADTTLEPWTVAYVPVGGARMRTYARKNVVDLGQNATDTISFAGPGPVPSPVVPVAVGTSGTMVPRPARESAYESTIAPAPWRAPHAEPIPALRKNDGVWLEFQGRRWYSDGEAVSYAPDRFTPVGEYHGFLVYREATGNQDQIWVAAVKDGPLAPYGRR
jgi:hypothetical protein